MSQLRAAGLFTLMGVAALGQDVPFQEEKEAWWRPAYALWVTSEHFHLGDDAPPTLIDRTRGALRLRWHLGEEDEPVRGEVGLVGYLGSDSNKHNLPWGDNEHSNGGALDVATLRLRGAASWGVLEAKGGLMENPLLSSESLWDGDLRVIGGSGRAFLRNDTFEEVGVRVVGGEVRLLKGGRVHLSAGQAVLRFQTGPFTWTAHGGTWRMEAQQEDAYWFLRSNPGPGGVVYQNPGWTYGDPLFRFTVFGAGVQVDEGLPFEVKALRHDNHDGGRGQELQVWVGSRTRAWWPQAGYIRQQLDANGALASVNGDQWWFHANADGERYVLALNLPQKWRVQADYVQQYRRDAPGLPITRTGLSVIKRF
jgi:hypothetical protein